VAKELTVDALITGRVLQRGDQLAISAELIDARSNRSLWGDRYDRKMSDLIGVQQDISGAIAARLQERLSGDAAKPAAKGGTRDPEAYQLYLKGDYYFQKRTPEFLEKAKTTFKQAIEKDPNYAAPWAELAAVYYVEPDYAPVSNVENMPKARAAAEKALAIDDTLALPHAVLAGIHNSALEWDAADHEFRRAIELNPNDPNSHNWYAFLLSQLGRSNEAIDQAKQAVALEPLNPKYNDTLGAVYRDSGQNERAIDEFQKTLDIDPNYPSALANLALTYFNMHQYDLWLATSKKQQIASNDQEMLAVVEEAQGVYAKSGYQAAMRTIIERELQLGKHRYVDPATIGLNYAALGEKDQAFAWLEKAYAEKSNALVWIKIDPSSANFRSDPRYAALLKKMGLPQ
jgi:Tfp pilus assembly protein PilF